MDLFTRLNMGSTSHLKPRSLRRHTKIVLRSERRWNMQFSFDTNLRDIADKVEDGERLTFDEGLSLYATDDLNALGKLADHVRRKKHGRVTFYNVNRHFNHTN